MQSADKRWVHSLARRGLADLIADFCFARCRSCADGSGARGVGPRGSRQVRARGYPTTARHLAVSST
eukprot:878113-Pyramimonas_sp.AAC.1